MSCTIVDSGSKKGSRPVSCTSPRLFPPHQSFMASSAPVADGISTAPSASSSVPSTAPRRDFEQLVQEELPVQRASLAMQGGAPTCMTLFDEFFSCFCESSTPHRRPILVPDRSHSIAALGNQARALYRYGHAKDCTPKFEEFKFCMSIKSLSDERREEVWVRRRAEMWARRRMGRCSDDVWTSRTGVYEQTEQERLGKARISD